MAKVKLIGSLKHDGQDYKAGDTFEGDKAVVDNLIALGAARDPKAVEEDTGVSLADAEAQAKAITGKAEEAAAVTAKEAEEAAAKVVADAEAQAKAKGDDIVKAAQAVADKLVADAKDEAKKLTDAAKVPAK